MLHAAFVHYLGHTLDTSIQLIESNFSRNIVVYEPGQGPDDAVNPSRLQIFINGQRIISKIVNG